MEPCIEVREFVNFRANHINSLNCILFGLELLIIQPDINYTPDCPQNHELLEIYQRDVHLFEKLVRENSLQPQNYSDMSHSNNLRFEVI